MRLNSGIIETNGAVHSDQTIAPGNDLSGFELSFETAVSEFLESSKSGVKVFGTLKAGTTSTPGFKTITFTDNFGMGAFGTVPSSVILRFNDGTSSHDFTAINAGMGGEGSFGTANQFAAGSDRPANFVVDEIVSKLNSSGLNLTAVAVGGNTDTNAAMKITPGTGATITITEDPNNINSGNFGGSAGFTTVASTAGSSTVKAASYSMFVVPPVAAPSSTFDFSSGVPKVIFGFSSHNRESDKINFGIVLVGEAK